MANIYRHDGEGQDYPLFAKELYGLGTGEPFTLRRLNQILQDIEAIFDALAEPPGTIPVPLRMGEPVDFNADGSVRIGLEPGFAVLPTHTMDGSEGWMCMRYRVQTGPGSLENNRNLFDLGEIRVNFPGNSDNLTVVRSGGTAAAQALSAGPNDDVTAIGAWSATEVKAAVQGQAFTTAADTNAPQLSAEDIYVGSRSSIDSYLDEDIFWVAGGNGPVVDADSAALHALGDDPLDGAFPDAMDHRWTWFCNGQTYLLYPAP